MNKAFIELPIKTRDYFYSGSRVICNPPVMDTDIDLCVLVWNRNAAKGPLVADGWTSCYDPANCKIEGDTDYPEFHMNAYRKGEYNLLVFDCNDAFEVSRFSTDLAKALNLTKKEDRVELFESMREFASGYLW